MIPQRVNIAVLRLELRELTLNLVAVSTTHAILLVPLKVNSSNFYMQAFAAISPKEKKSEKERNIKIKEIQRIGIRC